MLRCAPWITRPSGSRRPNRGSRFCSPSEWWASHFVQPKPFIRIVPAWLHRFNPRALVLVSGFFEIAGGIGLLLPRTQQLAAWGLIALYVAVFPANVNMAVHRISLNPKRPIPTYLLWLRLPFQLLFIAWAWWFV